MTKSRNYIFALLGLAALTAGAVVYQRAASFEGRSSPRQLAEKLIWEDIDSISIERESQNVILKRNIKNEWVIENDNAFMADAAKISRLLDSLTSAKIERTVTKKSSNPDEFGLGQTTTKVTLESKGKKQLSIALGESRTGGGQYFKYELSEHIYLLTTSIRPEAEAQSWSYKLLLKIPKNDVQSVQWNEGKNLSSATMYSRRSNTEKFEIAPASSRIKVENFNQLLDQLEGLSFEKRLPRDDKSSLKILNSPTRRVTVTMFDGRIITLVSGSSSPDLQGLVPVDISIDVDPKIGRNLSAAQAEEKSRFDEYRKAFFFLFQAGFATGESQSLTGRQR